MGIPEIPEIPDFEMKCFQLVMKSLARDGISGISAFAYRQSNAAGRRPAAFGGLWDQSGGAADVKLVFCLSEGSLICLRSLVKEA